MDIIITFERRKNSKVIFIKRAFYQNDTCIIFDYFSLFITFTTK